MVPLVKSLTCNNIFNSLCNISSFLNISWRVTSTNTQVQAYLHYKRPLPFQGLQLQ